MSLFSWLRHRIVNCAPRGRTSYQSRPVRFRPGLEALEERWLPSQVSLTVSSLADSGPDTLRAAIQTAEGGKPSDKFTIGFSVAGTINLQSPLPDLNGSIAIQGPGAASLTIERASGYSFSSAIFTVDAGQSASLSGLTIANGNDGGIFNNGILAVSGCTISGNFGINGGGIANFGTLTVSNSLLAGNSVFHDGGGIWNASTLTVSNSILSGNGASEDAGGAIFNFAGTLTVSASSVSGNSAAVGGGIYNQVFGSATIQQSSTLSGNSAVDGGGIVNAGTLTVRDSELSNNSASDHGGGVDNYGTATLQNSTLSRNTAADGGGIDNENTSATGPATLVLRGCTLSGNTASDTGGGIANAGTALIQQGSLSGNAAGSAGGGIFNAASGTLTVDDSMVSDNVAPVGADLDNLGVVILNDSTVGVIGP